MKRWEKFLLYFSSTVSLLGLLSGAWLLWLIFGVPSVSLKQVGESEKLSIPENGNERNSESESGPAEAAHDSGSFAVPRLKRRPQQETPGDLGQLRKKLDSSSDALREELRVERSPPAYDVAPPARGSVGSVHPILATPGPPAGTPGYFAPPVGGSASPMPGNPGQPAGTPGYIAPPVGGSASPMPGNPGPPAGTPGSLPSDQPPQKQ
jgi:hypothetical protein